MPQNRKSGFQLVELLLSLCILLALLSSALSYTAFGKNYHAKRTAEALVSFLHGARLLAIESYSCLILSLETPQVLLLSHKETGAVLHRYTCKDCALKIQAFQTPIVFHPTGSFLSNARFEITPFHATKTVVVYMNKAGRARIETEKEAFERFLSS